MKIRVTQMVVGRGFAFERGQEVDEAEFSAMVGTGWRGLCEPAAVSTERAVKNPPAERRSRG